MKYKYKNVSEYDQHIVNIGTVKAGGIIEVEQVIENPNLTLLEDSSKEDKKKE